MSYEKKYLPLNSDIKEEWDNQEARIKAGFDNITTDSVQVGSGGIQSDGAIISEGLYLSRENSVNGKSMNDIKQTGVYVGYTMTDSAVTGTGLAISTFIVIKYSLDWITQTQYFMGTGGNIQYNRAWVEGNRWTPWREVMTK